MAFGGLSLEAEGRTEKKEEYLGCYSAERSALPAPARLRP